MLAKKYRLTGKDINFMSKKRLINFTPIFSFLYCKQYSNRPYNQISCNIGVKISKKATTRNYLKRMIYYYISQYQILNKSYKSYNWKIFLFFSKNKFQLIQDILKMTDKKLMKNKFEEIIKINLKILDQKLATLKT